MAAKVEDEASVVTAEDGAVVVDGPGGVAVTLTPAAALETSDRLGAAAVVAIAQDAATPQQKP